MLAQLGRQSLDIERSLVKAKERMATIVVVWIVVWAVLVRGGRAQWVGHTLEEVTC